MEEKNPTNTVEETDAVATDATATESTEDTETTETSEDSSSQDEENLSALIEEEKQKGKPDPEKARERFLKSREKDTSETDDGDDEDDTLDSSELIKKQVAAAIAEERQKLQLEMNESRIKEISESLSDNAQVAELVREIHKNRVFPENMSLQEQLEEAHVIATAKRERVKNAELQRALKAKDTASRETATTYRDPQSSPEPSGASSDVKASLKRAGYIYNGQQRRYEKKLPNGSLLVKDTPTATPRKVNG